MAIYLVTQQRFSHRQSARAQLTFISVGDFSPMKITRYGLLHMIRFLAFFLTVYLSCRHASPRGSDRFEWPMLPLMDIVRLAGAQLPAHFSFRQAGSDDRMYQELQIWP